MKRFILLFLACNFSFYLKAQDKQTFLDYATHMRLADSLYKAHLFSEAASEYVSALETHALKTSKAEMPARMKAASSFALAGKADSAFAHLFLMAENKSLHNAPMLRNEKSLGILHGDKRWDELIRKLE